MIDVRKIAARPHGGVAEQERSSFSSAQPEIIGVFMGFTGHVDRARGGFHSPSVVDGNAGELLCSQSSISSRSATRRSACEPATPWQRSLSSRRITQAGDPDRAGQFERIGGRTAPCLDDVRPGLAPGDEARMLPAHVVIAARQQDAAAPAGRPGLQRLGDGPLAQRPVGEARVGKNDLAPAFGGRAGQRVAHQLRERHAAFEAPLRQLRRRSCTLPVGPAGLAPGGQQFAGILGWRGPGRPRSSRRRVGQPAHQRRVARRRRASSRR